MQRTDRQQELCPICDSKLRSRTGPYCLNDLFELWAPVQFSEGTLTEHFNQSLYTQLYSCPECKLGIFLPQIIGTANFYLDLSRNDSNDYYVDEKWDFEEALKDTKKDSSIVEIGCGPGNFLEKVQSYVAQACGTEHNEHALRIARGKGLQIFGADEDTSDVKGLFDSVFSFHVLEHVADPVGFLRELRSWVKPGGKIGISVPNQDGPLKYIDPCIQNMPPHHATRWHLRTFEVISNKLDLEIERVAYEPLIVRDHYYYSTYWIDYTFHEESLSSNFVRSVLRKILPILFQIVFRMLGRFNKNSLHLLKGQSIYVLMSTPKFSEM